MSMVETTISTINISFDGGERGLSRVKPQNEYDSKFELHFRYKCNSKAFMGCNKNVNCGLRTPKMRTRKMRTPKKIIEKKKGKK